MASPQPEKVFLAWFRSLPVWQRYLLAHVYVLMTSPYTGDFAMTGAECLRWFEAQAEAPDFPIRRVARILSLRAIFSFLFKDADFVRSIVRAHPAFLSKTVAQISPYQWQRSAGGWKRLTEGPLSDGALQEWLKEEGGG